MEYASIMKDIVRFLKNSSYRFCKIRFPNVSVGNTNEILNIADALIIMFLKK